MAINVQLCPFSSDLFRRNTLFFGRNSNKCTIKIAVFIADTATNKLYVFTYYEGLSIILVRFFTEFKQLVLNGMRNLCRNLHIY